MTSDQYILAITAIQNRLHACILSLLADPVAAQDVLQETNLVLIRKADDFQIDASFESWAYNTARFQVLVRLDFVNGASVVIDGPAKIEVVDEMRVVLLRGVVTATIPESAIGFVVDTETAHVVDLGTAFGVSFRNDVTTDVCVFEGEVEVSRVVEYPTPRAVEPRPEGDERPGFDSVILAADQRTLILDLKVAPQKLDQLRVLVEAD